MNQMQAQAMMRAGEHGEVIFRDSPRSGRETELVALLKECRMQLPLAAASWNEDGDPAVAAFHVPRVLDLLGRVNAAIGERA